MRIAFITYEFPPDIAQGGIATYVNQVATILSNRGHDIEVFCASPTRQISEMINGVFIHRCLSAGPDDFMHNVVNVFGERNTFKPFDIIESPEIHANALMIKEKFPEVPLVVKLHMALFVQMRLYNFYTPLLTKIRFFLGALKRGKIKFYGSYQYQTDKEYLLAKSAEAIVSPSVSLREIIIKEWKIAPSKIKVIPYPFTPPQQLLDIPIVQTSGKVVTFVGKLNVHKGLVSLVKAIPAVVNKHPDVVFRLIGNDSYFGTKNMSMSDYIKQELKGLEKNYVILGGLVYSDVLEQLATTTVCIFPSIWENFPLVCLEAMSAGRAVIGSKQGGMNEMLADGAGVIIDPLNVKQMSVEMIRLLDDSTVCLHFGEMARKKVLTSYNEEVIGKMLENHFAETIQNSNS